MENHVLPQLQLLVLSLLGGAAAAAIYDMLRAIRLRRRDDRLLTHLLDTVYVALAALALAAFGRRPGGGELRLYALLHMALGAALYFLLAASLLRPLWAFWAGTAADWARLLRLPAAVFLSLAKKIGQKAKKVFYFLRKYVKIGNYKWEFLLVHRRDDRKGGRIHREKQQKDTPRPRLRPHAGAFRPDRGHGRGADPDVQQAQQRQE
ncbi:MAG: hypothetical protein E7426_03525 [Ruminococcaceae bacterium]|nr:hypothetical protein [Oscillospiraceae bacterium]